MATPATTENWLRANLAGELCLKEALQSVLHNDHNDVSYTGLTRHGNQLHGEMTTFKNSTGGQELTRRKVIGNHQWDIICPPTSNVSNSDDWDIPSIKLAIQYKTNLRPPIGGWRISEPAIFDGSKAAHVCRAKDLRNKLKHGSIKELTNVSKYNTMLLEIDYVLQGLDYQNMQLFEDLKTQSLEVYTEKLLVITRGKLNEVENQVNQIDIKVNNIETKSDSTNLKVDGAIRTSDANKQKIDEQKALLNDLKLLLDQQVVVTTEGKDSFTQMQGEINKLRSAINNTEEILNACQEKDQEIEDRVSKVEKRIDMSDLKDAVLLDGLEIVSQEIGDKWEKLATILRIPINTSTYDTSYENMMECFSKCGYSISWSSLKYALTQLKEELLIQRLKDETNLTHEIDEAFKNHRKDILATFEHKQVLNPFMKSSGDKYDSKDHTDVFVDLAIMEGNDPTLYTDPNLYSQPEYYIRQSSLLKQNIDVHGMVCVEDKYVIVSGIPGIGKSQLVENIVWQWSNNEIFNGKDGMPNIQLLLPIKCRELNDVRFNSDDVEIMLTQYFPKLFKNIEVSSLDDLSHKIMFIIDGLDELISVEDIEKPSRCGDSRSQKILKFVKDLILSKQKVFIHQYTMSVGRPKITELIQRNVEKHTKIKHVQVCGFSTENVEKYIQKHCVSDELIERVKHEINSNTIMESMSHVPVYLRVICNIYKDDLSIKTPRTSTELMLYACLVFLRNHFKDAEMDISNLTLIELCEEEEVLRLITSIAKLSFIALKDRKIVFENAELHSIVNNVDELEKCTGLIVKSSNDSSITYQFTHLVLHEFFAALHIFLSDELQPKICCARDHSCHTEEVYVYHKPSDFVDADEEGDCAWCGQKTSDFKRFYRSERQAMGGDSKFFTHHNGNFEFITNLSYCYPILAGFEGLFAKNGLLSSLLQSLAKYSGSKPTDNSLMNLKTFHVLISFEGTFYDEYCIQSYMYYGLNDYIKCWYECGTEIPKDLVDNLINNPPTLYVSNRLLLVAQHAFVMKLKSIDSRFCFKYMERLIDPQLFTSKEIQCLIELMNCCRYHFYQHSFPKFQVLKDSSIEFFITFLERDYVKPDLLYISNDVNNLMVFHDGVLHFPDEDAKLEEIHNVYGLGGFVDPRIINCLIQKNLIVFQYFTLVSNCTKKKITLKSVQTQECFSGIEQFIVPVLKYFTEIELVVTTQGLADLGMGNFLSFLERESLSTQIGKVTVCIKHAHRISEYTEFINCLEVVQIIIVIRSSLAVFFEDFDACITAQTSSNLEFLVSESHLSSEDKALMEHLKEKLLLFNIEISSQNLPDYYYWF